MRDSGTNSTGGVEPQLNLKPFVSACPLIVVPNTVPLPHAVSNLATRTFAFGFISKGVGRPTRLARFFDPDALTRLGFALNTHLI